MHDSSMTQFLKKLSSNVPCLAPWPVMLMVYPFAKCFLSTFHLFSLFIYFFYFSYSKPCYSFLFIYRINVCFYLVSQSFSLSPLLSVLYSIIEKFFTLGKTHRTITAVYHYFHKPISSFIIY